MKHILPLSVLLLFLLAGGCSTQTLAPDDFLYAFRCGVTPGELGGNSYGSYAGRDKTYHYVELHGGRPTDTFLGDVTTRKVRCQADLLPTNFPRGFEPLRGTDNVENAEDTRLYVQNYLARHHGDNP